jgi:hypothetical protein
MSRIDMTGWWRGSCFCFSVALAGGASETFTGFLACGAPPGTTWGREAAPHRTASTPAASLAQRLDPGIPFLARLQHHLDQRGLRLIYCRTFDPNTSKQNAQAMTRGHATATTALMKDLDSMSGVKAKVRLKKRLGAYSIGLIGRGTLLILGCVACLGFLWLSNESNRVWHDIVISEWPARSITIVAVVLRGVAASQAVVATSMVVSLLL